MNLKEKRIYVAGSGGMVGSAVVRRLSSDGYRNIISRASTDLDLTRQEAVNNFFETEKPEIVVLAAARVGGILANSRQRGEFLYGNLMIEANVIHAAYQNGVEKLVFLGSSCIYPRLAAQPIREEELLTGPLEVSNEPYAIAKIAGVKLCESYYRQYGCNFVSAMPTNLYGPNDNFDLETSHVIPALINKIHRAKVGGKPDVVVWGTGRPRREFMFVDDLAEAIVFLIENVEAESIIKSGVSHLNIGAGTDLEVRELAELIKQIIGFEGELKFDTSMPDGTPQKLLDVSRMSDLGWSYKTSLAHGLKQTYDWFLGSINSDGPLSG